MSSAAVSLSSADSNMNTRCETVLTVYEHENTYNCHTIEV